MNELERKEYLETLNEYNQAMRNFNNAEPNFLDVAIFQVKSSQCKIDAFINARR